MNASMAAQRLLRQLRDRLQREAGTPLPNPGAERPEATSPPVDIDLDRLAWQRDEDEWLTRPAVLVRDPAH